MSYQICTKTVMDTSDPSIIFDSDGISNHYWNFHQNVSRNWHTGDDGRSRLEHMVTALKKSGEGRDFDCIMGLSGGADSSYMLHSMVSEFGLRPLVFHVDAGWNSETAVNNINVMVDKLRLDLYTEVINWESMKQFQLAMFRSGVPHLDIPQDMAFISVLYKFAKQHGIKYILNGGNISTECVLMPLQILYWGTDMRQINDILAKHSTSKLTDFPFSNVLYHKFYLKYFKGVNVFKPLNYIHYQKQEAMSKLQSLYGWKPYAQKHFESRFTRFLEGYWLPCRFNYDMRRNQYSSLILTGQMTRDEALEHLSKPPLSDLEVQVEREFICSKLSITNDELNDFFCMDKKYYWNYKNNELLFRIGEKVLSRLTQTQRGGAF